MTEKMSAIQRANKIAHKAYLGFDAVEKESLAEIRAAEAAAREEAIEECARWHDESTKLYENIAWQYGREGNDQGSAEMHQFRQEHQAAADHHRSLKEKEERSDDEAE